jgi:hypothetical protein
MTTYNGFSTVSSTSQKKFILTDNAIIKQDLINSLMTRRGQRVMQPNFGCIVWEKMFENLSNSDIEDVANNITQIINSDPRVALLSVDVTPSSNTITITIVIQYTGTNQVEQIILNYDNSISS